MKRTFVILSAALMIIAASCQKRIVDDGLRKGTLSFENFALSVDETVLMKSSASAAADEYYVFIYDGDGNEVMRKTYSEILSDEHDIELRAGKYNLVARTSEEEIPAAAFDQPVYGVTEEVIITAGGKTSPGPLKCTLVQCKVTVTYSSEFLEMVSGQCNVEVSLIAGHSLDYYLNDDGDHEQRAGYFAVEGNTMTVIFKGNINGKAQKQTKTFTDVAPRQWRQVKFIPMVNTQGDATFDIVIDDYIDDAPLNVTAKAEEDIIGDDPDAPKGDGGITLFPDHEAGCDAEITDLTAMKILPMDTPMSIILKAIVPAGIKKFTVDISTDSPTFSSALDAASAKHLDLIYPLEENMIIFNVVPFPHGEELLGMTEVPFVLSAAQKAIVGYKGTHSFVMTIVDMDGCRNQIPVVMIVE